MDIRGIQYDVGTVTIEGGLTRPELGMHEIERDLDLIVDGLHANAARVTGHDPRRLELAGRLAANRGLQVWLTPQLVNASPNETLDGIRGTAEVGERIRQAGGEVVVLVGAELSAFMRGVIPGDSVMDRFGLLSDPARLMPAIAASGIDPQAEMAKFLEQAAAEARSRFGGRVGYAAGLWEDVDWTPFDFAGIDAYRDEGNRPTFAEDVRARRPADKPLVITECGCATFRTAPDMGSLAWTVVDRSTEPKRLPAGIVRDEQAQAAELVRLLELFDEAGVEGAFIYTLIAPSYPSYDSELLDLDTAAYSLLRSWPDGRLEPKAAFAAVGEYFARTR